MREHIAVVIEDDDDIRDLLALVLTQGGFTVHAAADGRTGIALVREHDPIVVTIDVTMPGIDGFETARQVRSVTMAYVVMITVRSEEIDTLLGLQAGADDYIVKPFRPREVLARVQALLRRPRMLAPAHPGVTGHEGAADGPGSIPSTAALPAHPARERDDEPSVLRHRGLRLELGARIVELDGLELELTRSEFDILSMLLSSDRRVLSKIQLAGMLRDERGEPDHFLSEHDARAIEVHVANLRRKLGDSPAEPRWIETVRGVGYRRTA